VQFVEDLWHYFGDFLAKDFGFGELQDSVELGIAVDDGADVAQADCHCDYA
jgi:hypothetical protein